MRLELGRRADYAVRAAVDLARHRGDRGRRKAREIAQAAGIPASFVPQILAQLVRAGIVSSVTGAGGGYALAEDPTGISLLDIVVAVDGDLASTRCVLRSGACSREGICAVHGPWTRAQTALRDELDRTSLARIVDIEDAMTAGKVVS
jgi:Rrf2 family protein